MVSKFNSNIWSIFEKIKESRAVLSYILKKKVIETFLKSSISLRSTVYICSNSSPSLVKMSSWFGCYSDMTSLFPLITAKYILFWHVSIDRIWFGSLVSDSWISISNEYLSLKVMESNALILFFFDTKKHFAYGNSKHLDLLKSSSTINDLKSCSYFLLYISKSD